jgi:hypothetical protein
VRMAEHHVIQIIRSEGQASGESKVLPSYPIRDGEPACRRDEQRYKEFVVVVRIKERHQHLYHSDLVEKVGGLIFQYIRRSLNSELTRRRVK